MRNVLISVRDPNTGHVVLYQQNKVWHNRFYDQKNVEDNKMTLGVSGYFGIVTVTKLHIY